MNVMKIYNYSPQLHYSLGGSGAPRSNIKCIGKCLTLFLIEKCVRIFIFMCLMCVFHDSQLTIVDPKKLFSCTVSTGKPFMSLPCLIYNIVIYS